MICNRARLGRKDRYTVDMMQDSSRLRAVSHKTTRGDKTTPKGIDLGSGVSIKQGTEGTFLIDHNLLSVAKPDRILATNLLFPRRMERATKIHCEDTMV